MHRFAKCSFCLYTQRMLWLWMVSLWASCPEGTQKVGDVPPEGSKTFCVRETENGYVLEGPRKLFYPNGKIKQESFYKNGKLHGEKIDWSVLGTKLQVWVYDEGKPLQQQIFRKGRVIHTRGFDKAKRKKKKKAKKKAHVSKKKPKPAPPPEPEFEIPWDEFVCELSYEPLENRLEKDQQRMKKQTYQQLSVGFHRKILLSFDESLKFSPKSLRYTLVSESELGAPRSGPANDLKSKLNRKLKPLFKSFRKEMLAAIKDKKAFFESALSQEEPNWPKSFPLGNQTVFLQNCKEPD